MFENNKEKIKKGFSWGRREHYFEKITNTALYITIILFVISYYLKSWYLMMFVFTWLLISTIIHLIARFCHRQENKYHHFRTHRRKLF